MSARRADLRGDLALFAPELVLQILALARASGVLVLECAGTRGNVFLRDGKIVAARVESATVRAPKRAVEAAPRADAASTVIAVREDVATMLGWRRGAFAFRSGAEPKAQGVALDVEGLLLECMTRMDRVRGGAREEQGS